MSMSLTGSRFSSECAPGPLYGTYLVKKSKGGWRIFFLSSVTLFDLGFAHLTVSSATARLPVDATLALNLPMRGYCNKWKMTAY